MAMVVFRGMKAPPALPLAIRASKYFSKIWRVRDR
jgi:hypothetical protein